MLEGLDAVVWHKLEHAYGEATDVPELLRALASDNAKARSDALYALYGNIWHQGTVYEATAYAVPFLGELLAAPDVMEKHRILMLLSSLATGNSYLDVHQHLEWIYSDDERESDEFQDQITEELGWVKAAHEAVYQQSGVILPLLKHDDRDVRCAAGYVLASFPEHYATFSLALQQCIEQEDDPIVIGSMLMVLGYLLPARDTDGIDYLHPFLGLDNDPVVCFSAAIALAYIARDAIPHNALGILVDTLTDNSGVEDAYNQITWVDTDIRATVSSALCFVGAKTAEPIIPRLIEALPELDFFSVTQLVEAILYLLFGQEKLPEGVTAADLTPVQRNALKEIASHALQMPTADGKPMINGNIGNLLHAYGLPGSPDQLRSFFE